MSLALLDRPQSRRHSPAKAGEQKAEQLMADRNRIYDRTAGRCHICGKHLARKNYGKQGSRGSWEVEHSIARARGGSDHGNNLYPACITCNRAKGTASSRTARAKNGRTRAPLSVRRQEQVRARRTVGGGLLGMAAAGLAGAPLLVPMGIAALVGYALDPED